MNNEPVAWMHKTYFPNGLYEEDLVWSKIDESSIPLYTHSAELTDEEIIDIIERLIADWTDEFKNYENDSDEPEENKLRDDVFAILRKAQEK